MILDIKYKTVTVASVEIDEKTIVKKQLMQGDFINAEFITDDVIPFRIGSYVEHEGESYYIRKLPTLIKLNNNRYKYSIVFESEFTAWKDKLLISSDGLTEFSYTGTADSMLTMLVAKVNEIKSGWVVTSVDTTTKKTLEFYNETCYEAIYKIAEAFDLEFTIKGKAIAMHETIGTAKSYVFQYGLDKGLYSLERRLIANAPHYTRIYGFGGTTNIPYTYRDNAQRLIFEGDYLEKETGTYGVKEGIYINEDIYPQRTSTLTAVNMAFEGSDFDADTSYVEDTTLNFDINDQLLEGETATIVFKSGDLSGYEFEIWKYDATTKRMYINAYSEENGFTLPRTLQKAAVNDEYTLVNINMPQSYIIEAEAALKAATQKEVDDSCIPKELYVAKFDEKYIKKNNITLNVADVVTVTDLKMGIDRAIRISEVSYPLVVPKRITALISDEIIHLKSALASKQSAKAAKQLAAVYKTITNEVYNKTVNQTTNVTNTTTVVNEKLEVNIGGKLFPFEKHFDNTTNLTQFETNDFLIGGSWNRFTVIKKWQFTGTNKLLRDNYNEIETIELEP